MSESTTESRNDESDRAAEGEEEPLLSLKNIEVHFKQGGLLQRVLGEEAVRAVDDVSLDIYENDVIALVGESGCGKTTLGKTAIGLQRPTGGTVEFRGEDFWEVPEEERSELRRALQIIHQDPAGALNPNRTVRSTLAEPLKRWNPDMGPGERESQINELLERVGMTPAHDYATRYPHQLSGGEQQRVALGRALLMEPDIILADEAVSALDVSLRIEMMDLLLELQDFVDTSYVFISHDLANARYLAEKSDGRIGVMYLGNLVEIGSVDQILKNPQHPYTKVMLWSTPVLNPDIAEKTANQAPPVRQIDVPDPADPPSGCPFQTRCPEAREVCAQQDPDRTETEDGHEVACFRQEPDHDYWQSPPLEEPQPGEAVEGTTQN
ncbi:oligopeptide/dipeptide ABC transporter ATP-binding protein [Halosimplex pelagicum]|uniref:ABC transporter ATP-binding protein n=1 Tax=Halosimplex pelagicum TaxID=869886 RepID=A0A7D5T528_9EURY|nr:ABC transporter ATP-binding protein [Halosimplex pelagicum]QLH82008.1 ABC transporter ATP-binding protein [Halosimplex pelagicum]